MIAHVLSDSVPKKSPSIDRTMSPIFGIRNGWFYVSTMKNEFPEIIENFYSSVYAIIENLKFWGKGRPYKGIVFFKDSDIPKSMN
jgi:hypothetical protein